MPYRDGNDGLGPALAALPAEVNGECGPVVPVGARLLRDAGEGSAVQVAAEAGGRFGCAFQIPYRAGRRTRIDLVILPELAQMFRIEVHGTATRMQKAYAELRCDGTVVAQGEEVTALTAEAQEGCLRVSLELVPPRNAFEWFYVFAESPPDPELSRFQLRSISTRAERDAPRRLGHLIPQMIETDGVRFFLSSLYIFRNYVQLDFEIHKPGVALAGLELVSPRAFEVVQWWTHETVARQGPDGLVGRAPSLTPRTLTPRSPAFPLPSPARMEQEGSSAAWLGHRITALYAELQNFAALAVPETDAAARGIELAAWFADGSEVRIPLATQRMDDRPENSHEYRCILEHAQPRAEGMPVLLEVGARGEQSARTRRFFAPAYRYVAVDYSAGPNVDVVADAHRLSEAIQPGSVDVVLTDSVLEHLLAPQRFVIEANRVLRPGGLFVAFVPVTWPLHAEPWDFWRVSAHGWRGLLNAGTGFELLSVREFGNAAIVPSVPFGSGMTRMQHDPAPLFSAVLARKAGEATAEWTAWWPELAAGRYDP